MEFPPPIQHGILDAAYSGPRHDVIELIPPGVLNVLDVGCSVGTMGEVLQRRGCVVTGIEISPESAHRAGAVLSRVIEGDVEVLAQGGTDVGGPFDCIVFADVLEHLRNPWAVTRWASGMLSAQGSMVISVPNVRHAHLIRSVLLHRHWPYEDVGIFDRTHMRWFAYRNLPELLSNTGLEIAELRRTYALHLNPSARINRLARYLGDFGTLQFVFRAEKDQRT
jgi:2-polyprenyl-3-methyl-5-hydroxy-6-metoxy-1,4-benzoquinol methylase